MKITEVTTTMLRNPEGFVIQDATIPPLKPESPWHGYSLGEWSDTWERAARNATRGEYLRNGERTWQMRRAVAEPQTPLDAVPDED